jgi:tetratricopeptide (TPR) repeat protein
MRRFARVAGALAAFANAASVRERLGLLEALGIAGLRGERGDAGAAGLTAERLRRYLFLEAANLSQQAYGRGELKKAGALIELAVLIDPGSGQAWFNLACIRSRLGEKKGALRALKAAIRNGMRDLDAMEKDPDLDALRGEAAYARLLAALKKSLAEKKL